ncbi:149_t:CDS:1, partial [Paraglomus occultum]
VDNLIIGGGVIGLAFLRTNEILTEFTADERALLDQIFNEWLSVEMKDQRQDARGKDIVSGGSVKVSNFNARKRRESSNSTHTSN